MSDNTNTLALQQQATFQDPATQQQPDPNAAAEAFHAGRDNVIPSGPSAFDVDPSPVEIPENLLSDEQTAEHPTENLQEQLSQIAGEYGLDPSQLQGFSDAQSAEAAASLFLDQQIQQGLSALPIFQQNQSVQSEPQNQPKNPVSLDQLDLDEENLDPKTIKAIRTLAAEVQNSRQTADQLRQQFEQVQTQQVQAQQQQNFLKAMNVVDSLQNERFGNSANRNGMQQLATQQLLQVADALGIADNNAGRAMRPIETRVKIAAKKLEGGNPAQPKQTQAGPHPKQQNTQLTLQPTINKPMTESAIPEGQPPVQLGTLHRDQNLLRQAAQILSRRG